MIAVLVDWSSAWVCAHAATACHVSNHGDDDHTHTHDHGPFQHPSGEGPDHVQHRVKLLGVLDAPDSRHTAAATHPAQPDQACDRAPGSVRHPLASGLGAGAARPFPRSYPAGRALLLKTERWLS